MQSQCQLIQIDFLFDADKKTDSPPHLKLPSVDLASPDCADILVDSSSSSDCEKVPSEC